MTDLGVNSNGMDSASRRAWRRVMHSPARGWVLDVALGVVAAYVAVILTVQFYGRLPTPFQLSALLLAGVHGSAVAFRPVAPRTVVAVQVITAVGYVALGLPVFLLGPAILVALYTVGSRLPRRTALALLGLVEAAVAVLLLPGSTGLPRGCCMRPSCSEPGVSACRAPVAGRGGRARAARYGAGAGPHRAGPACRDRRAVRIARELHDVVAHSMSVIAMHAGSGRLAADKDPAAARRALEVIERSSRDALAEMRRVVTVLREADEAEPELAPAAGLRDVHQLVAEVAAAGVTVEVHTSGDLASVPDGVSLAAYRIVQEALTNVVRHASPAQAHVSVRIGDGEVALEVTDDGATRAAARAAAPASGGHGTIGMRERAALYGGELVAGPRPEGGWRVAARLPYAVVDR